jgi:hypothetical protein
MHFGSNWTGLAFTLRRTALWSASRILQKIRDREMKQVTNVVTPTYLHRHSFDPNKPLWSTGVVACECLKSVSQFSHLLSNTWITSTFIHWRFTAVDVRNANQTDGRLADNRLKSQPVLSSSHAITTSQQQRSEVSHGDTCLKRKNTATVPTILVWHLNDVAYSLWDLLGLSASNSNSSES